MDLDDVFREVGELGRQQLFYCTLLCLSNTYAAMHMLQYAFVSFPVEFECTSSSIVVAASACPSNNRTMCDKLVFKTDKSSSIVSEWGLVCDENWNSKATMSSFMAGVMVGALLLGRLADSIGRRSNMALTTLGSIIFNTVSAFVSSYHLYMAAKFSVGFFVAGNILSTFVLGNELVGPSKRGIFGVIIQSFFALGIILFALIAYHFQHWRQLTLVVSLVGAPCLTFYFLIPESPRWLIAQNRTSEAMKVLETIARGNGALFSAKLAERKEETAGSKAEGLCDLFTHRYLLTITLVQIYSWFVNSGAYYGLTLAAGSSGGGLYASTALSGAVEIPAYMLTNVLLACWGRRRTLVAFMLVGGAACLFIQAIPASYLWLITSAALVGKLCLAASFAVIYIHSGEIFPTTIRNSAMGLVSVAARCGGIVAPFIVLLGEDYPNLQFTVFGLLAVTAGLANLRLPETLGKPLPEDIRDMILLDPALAPRRRSTHFPTMGGKNLKPSAKNGFRRIQSDSRILLDAEDSD